MNFSNKILILSVTAATFFNVSCSEDKNDDFTGSWVSEGFFREEKFTTLTITDSTITENEFGLNRMDYLIIHENNRFEIVDAYHYNAAGFTLAKSNEKLILANATDDNKIEFSKINFTENYPKLLFSDADLKIELPEIKGSEGISIEPKEIWSSLYVGIPKNAKPEFSAITDSSYQIQFFYNRPLQVKDISNFLKFEITKLVEADRNKLKIILFADKGIPPPLLKDIINALKKEDSNIKIYRAYLNLSKAQFQYVEVSLVGGS